MNRDEQRDRPDESEQRKECTALEQRVYSSELGEQQMRRLGYREQGQLGPGTY